MLIHQIEQRLPDSGVLAQIIAENSVHGLAMMDNQGYCLYANQAWLEMTGFTLDEFKDKTLHDLVHHHRPDGRPFPIEECPIGCTLGKNMKVRGHEDLFFRKDGTPFPVACAATPIVKDGVPVLMILEVRDISEEKKVQEQLQASDRRKDEFLAMLAHELRNPMAPILAAAELLRLAPGNGEIVKRSSTIIDRQIKHMVGLVDDLLDVSRVTRGMVLMQKTQVDMKRVVAEAVEQAQPLIEARKHSLTLNLTSEEALVNGEQMRLIQVLANLLNNAAKYTPEGGTIALTLQSTGTEVQVTVSDTGIGMAPDMVRHAFDLFIQAERAPDRSQGGLGLGLALVKSLVELHGGTVSCSSAGLGSGSTFSVSLPRLVEQYRSTPHAPEENRITSPGESLRILVVDDNEDAAQTLAMLLDSMGHEVLVEHDPYRALETAVTETPRVCMLDIGLPGIDGNELARRLRARPENANTTLIALTGYGQEDDRATAYAAGFDYYLVKPVDAKKLGTILAGMAPDKCSPRIPTKTFQD